MDSFEDCIEKYRQPEGLYDFSDSKDYMISEEYYLKFLDASTRDSIEFLSICGDNLARKLKELDVPSDGFAVEIGCGAGAGSRRLLAGNYFKKYLLTDASRELTLFTKKSIESYEVFHDRDIKYGVMIGEDSQLLPEKSVSAFFLFATLHHFHNWQDHLTTLSSRLRKNGIIFCVEPSFEFATTMSILFICFNRLIYDRIAKFKPGFFNKMHAFINASKFRGNPYIENKESQEDKHIFRVDALYRYAQQNSLKLYIYPNSTLANFQLDGIPPKNNFRAYVESILKNSQHFENDLCELFFDEMKNELEYLEYFWDAGQGPFCNFIIIFQKTS